MNIAPRFALPLLALGLLAGACEEAPQASAPPSGEDAPFEGSATNAPEPWPAQKTPLAQAHEAFLDADYEAMVHRLHTVLTDPNLDDATRDNALELIEVAYDDTGGRLPSPWSLPDGLVRLSMEQIRKVEPGQLAFRLVIRGWSKTPDLVQGVTLRAEPGGEVLLDRSAGVGAWSLGSDGEGNWEFELEGPERRTVAPEGVYTISLTLADGAKAGGWFFLSGLTSTATPVLRSPRANTVVSERRPLVRWDAFRSPEHRSFEQQSLGVWLLALGGAEASQVPRWTLWTQTDVAAREHVRLGDDPLGSTTGDLEEGDYWLALTFKERRHFGPLQLYRASRTALPFSIRASP